MLGEDEDTKMAQTNTHARFVRELRSLIRAPYSFIHLQTFEEERALILLRELAASDNRGIREWSAISSFDGQPSNADFLKALAIIESSPLPGIFVCKDVSTFMESPVVRRRLREMEAQAAAFHKTIIFLGSEPVVAAELQKDITVIQMPLPDRDALWRECEAVFKPEIFPDIDREALVNGAMGLTSRESHRAFFRVRLQYEEAASKNLPFDLEKSIIREKQQLVSTNDALEFFPLEAGMGDVGGLGELKAWLDERQRAFGAEARAFGLPHPRGVLLIGVQGCGKSLTAKVIGRHWGLPLLRLDLGAVFEGKKSPEESLRLALATADALAPCILWMDEIEKGFGDTSDGGASRVLGSLLTWQQEKQSPVFLVATANQVEALPPELMRKGRFDEIFFVDLPEIQERVEILRIHLTRHGRFFENEVVDKLAAMTEHFSGAELEQVVISGMYTAFASNRDLALEDLEFAVKETVPLYRTYEENIKALRQWADGRARRASRRRKVLDFFG